MSSTKLHYEIGAEAVVVAEFTGENWSDPEREIVREVSFNVADIPAVLETPDGGKTLAAYGLAKLLQDRTSQDKESATVKLDAMLEHFEVFKSGKWRTYKEGAGRRATVDPLLAQAVAKIKKAPLAAVVKKLGEISAEERKALSALDAVQAEIAKLREQADTELDLSSL